MANPLYFYGKSGGSYKITEPSLLSMIKLFRVLGLVGRKRETNTNATTKPLLQKGNHNEPEKSQPFALIAKFFGQKQLFIQI